MQSYIDFTFDKPLPNNLCEYFWKLVLSIIIFIPKIIFLSPFFIVLKIGKSDPDEFRDDRLQISFIIWAVIFMLLSLFILNYHFIGYLTNSYSFNKNLVDSAKIYDFTILATIIVSFAMHLYGKYRKYRNRPKYKSSNILKEFIKAKYYKYCPKIEWIDESENDQK